MVLKREDWLLMLLGLPDEQGRTPSVDRVRVIECLFILEKRMPAAVAGSPFYDFQPHNYGPFDAAVYHDAEAMEAAGDVQTVRERYVGYRATPQGQARAASLRAHADPKAVSYLLELRKWANNVDFTTLVKSVYQEFPEQRAKSIFRG